MDKLEKILPRVEGLLARLESLVPPVPAAPPDFAAGRAWRWRPTAGGGYLAPVRQLHDLRLDDLRCLERQREICVRNTEQFVSGLPANNVLLWGARGTGKSSLVKALLPEFAPRGLRLIEVEKYHLVDLPEIVVQLAGRPQWFIIFCDDLSFGAEEPNFRALKAALDGSLSATPANVLIYATSNRRHLLPEFAEENLAAGLVDGELHSGEAVEEKISLAERFGLWLAFHPLRREQYEEIVFHWLSRLGVAVAEPEVVRREARRWGRQRGAYNGRTAWHFARDWAGRQGLAARTGR
ncbi:MAG: ATP-binding protein [Deltaproteobacteria bacterium]|nr:ATP-binding protein [Deltaproteobacteria bacterium]